MTAPTINRINAALAAKDLPFEIVRGAGYFYFAATEGAPYMDEIKSVYSMHLRAMSLEEYVDHVQEAVDKFKEEQNQ
jgi:hypothetical protein